MKTSGNDPLLLAGKVLTLVIQGFLGLSAAALLVVVVAIAIFGGDLAEGFADGSQIPVGAVPTLALLGLTALLLAIIAALFRFFGQLRAIIDTVAEGDPFAPANAERLSHMAWLLLGAQVLVWPMKVLLLIVAEWANELENVNVSIEVDGLDLTGVLMVLVLFILARVFRHGAAMREDLEGTV